MYDFEVQPYRCVPEIDYDCFHIKQPTVKRLKELCANRVIRAGILTPAVCVRLPQLVRHFLIHCSIWLGRRNASAALLDSWPLENFVYIPPVPMGTWETFVMHRNPAFNRKHAELSVSLNCLIDHFITSVTSRRGNQSRIQCLDLSAFPIRSIEFRSIVTVDARQICPMYPDDFTYHIKPLPGVEPGSGYIPAEGPVIKLFSVLCTALDLRLILCARCHLRYISLPLHLRFVRVHNLNRFNFCLDLYKLFEVIEPHELDAFGSYFPLARHKDHQNSEILAVLHKFVDLRVLNFELIVSSSISRDNLHDMIRTLSSEVCQLKKLEHFYLNQKELMAQFQEFPVYRFLPFSLSSVEWRLQCLMLNGSNLSVAELNYLRQSSHADTLRTLSLCHSWLDLPSLTSLLAACVNLRVLDLEGNNFQQANIDDLFRTLSKMKELKCLKLMLLDTSTDDLMSKASLISRMPSLECLSLIPSIFDVLDSDSDDEDSNTFEKRFHNVLKTLWGSPRNFTMF